MDVDWTFALPSPDADVSDWKDLQVDLLNEISRCLNFQDYISFRLTCKNWNQSPSTSVFSNCNSKFSVVLIFDDKDGTCFVYNLSEASVDHQQGNLQCTILNVPELVNSTVITSCDGWLLVKHMDGRRVFLLNPFGSAPTIELPPFPHLMNTSKNWYGIFIGTPKEEKFEIQVACYTHPEILASKWVPGRDEWQFQQFPLADRELYERSVPNIMWCKRSDSIYVDLIGKLRNVFKQFVRDTREDFDDDDDEINDVMMKRIKEKGGELTVQLSGGFPSMESWGFKSETSQKTKLGILPGNYSCVFSGDGHVEIRQGRSNPSFGSVQAAVVEPRISKFL